MGTESWPPDEIVRIASTAGKSLEVRCAQLFLSEGWSARLGSYFADGELNIPRELDVLAEKSAPLITPKGVEARIRAVISCRDFPDGRSPLTYSVTTRLVPSFTPRVFAEHFGPWQLDGSRENHGSLPGYEALGAKCLLQHTDGGERRHIVAFDMIERIETIRKDGQGPVVNYSRMRDGDSSVFKAVDSAIKAAQYWRRQDYNNRSHFATITVPILLLGGSFWDVCIDGGEISDPKVAYKGWMANLFPTVGGPACELTSLIWAVDEIAALVSALDQTFAWFSSAIDKAYESATRRVPQ